MAWTAPRTYVAGEVHTAATLNTDHRDNLIELRGGGVAITSQANGRFVIASSATQLTTSRSVPSVFAEEFG